MDIIAPGNLLQHLLLLLLLPMPSFWGFALRFLRVRVSQPKAKRKPVNIDTIEVVSSELIKVMVGMIKERKEGGRSQCLGGTERPGFIHIL